MTDDIWTIKAALDWTMGYLERKGDENPRLSAQWLLAEATGLRRIELYTHFEQPLSLNERGILRDFVARRGAGEPLQYITGEVGFRHISVKVRSGVLIPRPETEVLVSEALTLLPVAPRPRAADDGESSPVSSHIEGSSDALSSPPLPDAYVGLNPQLSDDAQRDYAASNGISSEAQRGDEASSLEEALEPPVFLVADICTGSGCIACSVAYEHPQTHVVATDISRTAVALAYENAESLGLSARVDVVECDLGEGIAADMIGNFDLIVSNPPYVPTSVLNDIPREVADFEPSLALDGGDDGLDILRRLLPFCARALKPGGAFAFELHETCLDEAASLAIQAGFEGVRIVNDLAERPRVLIARTVAE